MKRRHKAIPNLEVGDLVALSAIGYQPGVWVGRVTDNPYVLGVRPDQPKDAYAFAEILYTSCGNDDSPVGQRWYFPDEEFFSSWVKLNKESESENT